MVKKLGSAARFGARYGKTIKERVLKIENEEFKKHDCPSCGKTAVKRKAVGVFECRFCHFTFAGGAYLPQTMQGKTVKKMLQQKTIVLKGLDLESAKPKDLLSSLKESLEKTKEELEA